MTQVDRKKALDVLRQLSQQYNDALKAFSVQLSASHQGRVFYYDLAALVSVTNVASFCCPCHRI